MFKYFLLWFPMLLIAIFNGAIREFLIKKYTNDIAAHQLSTVMLLIFFSFYIRFVIKKFPPSSATSALIIGIFWVILTLGFEFGFGRWRGHSWGTLFQEYNLAKGRIWLLIPVCLMFAPYLFFKFKF